MKVIKAFGNERLFCTLPPYDGSHRGNVNAWLAALKKIGIRDSRLHQEMLRKIFEFSKNESDELDIVSTLLRQNMRYDIRVIWRRRDCTLHMYSLKNVESQATSD